MSDYWKEVSRQKSRTPDDYTQFTIITFEHELPHGKLVMACSGYGEGRNCHVVFVPAAPANGGVYR